MSLLPDFDARAVAPKQGGGSTHPVGMFDFQITNTYLKETNDREGLMFVVEKTSPVGVIETRYNVVNKSKQAEEISQGQLSALCHAVNVYKISYPKDQNGNPIFDQAGRELRGAIGRMEIAPQMRKNAEGKFEPTGFNEVKKVYDKQGNEPGKGPANAAQPMQQQPQPQPGQPPIHNGWGNPPPQQQPNQGFQPPNNAPTVTQPQPQGGWQQPPQNNAPAGGSAPNGAPPWAQR